MFIQRQAARSALRSALLEAAEIFGCDQSTEQTNALNRHLDAAVQDYDRVLPCVATAELTWTAGTADYAAPADALGYHTAELVDEQGALDPYDAMRVEQVPTPMLVRKAGVKTWRFRPAPTAGLLARLGCAFRYTYTAAHQLGDDGAVPGTLEQALLPQVVTRALVVSLLELAIRNSHKPVALRDPTYSQTRNGTPAALADQLMRVWETQVRPTSDPYGLLPVAGGRR